MTPCQGEKEEEEGKDCMGTKGQREGEEGHIHVCTVPVVIASVPDSRESAGVRKERPRGTYSFFFFLALHVLCCHIQFFYFFFSWRMCNAAENEVGLVR